jgi:hypothetical protein
MSGASLRPMHTPLSSPRKRGPMIQHDVLIDGSPLAQSNSGLPEFDQFDTWPKSETSDFG